MTRRHRGSYSRLARAGRIALVCLSGATSACGSDESGGGAENSSPNDNCALAIRLTGDHPFDSDLGAEMGCATAFSTMPGAYTAFTPTEDGEIAIRIAFPELDPGIPAAATPQPVRIDLADGTQFSPMGCMGDVTQNALDEATPDGDIYRVSGEGSCDAPGVSGDRSIEVVGTFRFVALIRWQN